MERATTTSSSSGYLRTLQVELTRLLGRPAKERANNELREYDRENRSSEQLDLIADKPDHYVERRPQPRRAQAPR